MQSRELTWQALLLQVLQADSSNVKALFRRAQAHLALQDFVEAELDIKAALLVGASPSADYGSNSHAVKKRNICRLCIISCDTFPDVHANELQTSMALQPMQL